MKLTKPGKKMFPCSGLELDVAICIYDIELLTLVFP